MDRLYRFEDRSGVVLLRHYWVRKTTPAGVWIDMGGGTWKDGKWKPHLKFVNLGSRKRFACPTEEEAKESFFARKDRQLGILRAQAKNVEQAVAALRAGVVGQEYYRFDLGDSDG